MSAGRKTGLGRGLSALMSDAGLSEPDTPVNTAPADDSAAKIEAKSATGDQISELVDDARDPNTPREQPGVLNVAISRLRRNPDQPRKVFDRDKLDDLIASIQQKGVLQPVLVRTIPESPVPNSPLAYQIVAGERRWQAAIKAGLTSIPIIVRNLSDRDVLEIGVIENVQRADLNPLEEAMAYERLITEFGRTQAEIATTIGKSRVHVANTVRLTGLSERARGLLLDGKITAGHARALLAAADPDALAEAIVKNDWSVREAETWVKEDKTALSPPKQKAEKSADIKALEQRIRDMTGYAADIRHNARGGEIRLKYKDLDDMEALLKKLGLMGS